MAEQGKFADMSASNGECSSLTYAAAGVDLDEAGRLVGRIREIAGTAGQPEVLSGVGPFAGLFRLGTYREPVLVSSTDSVGTKVKFAALPEALVVGEVAPQEGDSRVAVE